ncbi:uncharacterized protein LOC34623623 [Cyclospora cayetanensis]|uniref:Uncharacterized protein LOC34623623 n=1 Tax=Cyclospora cayetanensis TaxID=88456 RepID=A0A6P6RZD5_9EIME|nr:uncharacterized protein LOC34623623 [Cyclospora cayetanensis]
MGNRPSYSSVPLDGYLAARASIEARFSHAAASRQRTASPSGCCGTSEDTFPTMSAMEHHPCSPHREHAKFSREMCLEQRGAVSSGLVLPPSLSVAETTDTNSDGAPDEFEGAQAAEDMFSRLSQSFTRVKAPHVRARSPLPFPSMANCSPTVSKGSDAQQAPLCNSSIAIINERDYTLNSERSPNAVGCPQPKRKPQQPAEALIAPTAGPHQTKQLGTEAGTPSGRPSGLPKACINESDMLCPLSPNSALGSISPPAVAFKGASAKSTETLPETGAPVQGTSKRFSVSYGPLCNHSPFMEGRAVQILLQLLLGPSLGACMGVCVHWFMKISDALADMCAHLSKDLEASYGKFLSPVSATLKFLPLQIAGAKGTRLDWVITARVLPPAADNVLSLGYCFEYRNSWLSSPSFPTDSNGSEHAEDVFSRQADLIPLRTTGLRSEEQGREIVLRPFSRTGESPKAGCRREVPTFSVAIAPAGSKRRVWLHRDMCRFHGDETGQAALAPLGPVCVGDFIELPVVLANGIGIADLHTIRWLPMHVAPRLSRVVSGPKALEAAALGLYEGCGLEMQYVEWFDGDQYRHMTTERLKRAECLEPELHHISTSYSGVDVLVRRSTYNAAREGSLGAAAKRAWGLQCRVLPADAPIVFPLTRRGLLHDRATSFYLRVGDTLDSYLTVGGGTF